jgi:hypothetical protein
MSGEPVRVEQPEVPAKIETQKQPPARQVDFGPEIEKLLPSVGTIELTTKEKQILYAPVDDDQVEIRPDGLIYLSWMRYVTRLRDALGIAWGLIPQGLPRVKDGYMIWPFWFLIRGTLVTFVVGEQQIQSGNMTWAEAAEGCRSNALMRACKALGISLELWDRAFIRQWKDKYAVQGTDKKWSRKMTAQEAVDKTKEVFPGAEVVVRSAVAADSIAAGEKTPGGSAEAGFEFPGEKARGATGMYMSPDVSYVPDPPVKSSALMFSDWHDEMIRLNHMHALRSWWEKVKPEAEAKLHPEHFKRLELEKTKMRQFFLDKAAKENLGKGGK